VYVVGRYRPAGNYFNMLREKVLKGSFNERYCSKYKKPAPPFEMKYFEVM